MDKLSELQKEVDQLNVKLSLLEKKFSIEEIILRSKYRVLTFYGVANGVASFTRGFDFSLIQNQNILIKAIRFFPYYVNDSEDIRFSDGTYEIIPAGGRVNRVLDTYSTLDGTAHFCRIVINGSDEIISVRSGLTQGTIPADLSIDNIYANYKNIQDLSIILNTEIFETLSTPGTGIEPLMKVIMEVYIYA